MIPKSIITGLLSLMVISLVSAQEWEQSESFDTLFIKEALSGLLQIHTTGDRMFAATLKSDLSYRVYASDDNGGSWTETSSDNTAGSYAVFANVDSDTIYSYGADLFGTRVLRKSTDAGSNWAVQTADYSNFPFFFTATQFAAINDTLVLTSTARSAGILKSVDGGATWNSFIEFSDNDQNKGINGLESYGSYFFLSASSNGEGLFRSHRDSSRWVNILSLDGVSESMYGFSIDSDGILYALTHEGIQFSEDSGETWTLKTSAELGISETGTPTHIKVMGEDLLIAFANGGEAPSILKLKKDFSSQAEDISTGFTTDGVNTRVLTLETTSTSVLATRVGVATALYLYNGGQFSTNSEAEDDVQGFQLSQNYPNPFNPNTTISFSIPEVSEVSLKVFNMLGQEVATLVEGQMNAGSQTLSFDASNLSSGVYIYRLQAGSKVQTKRMLLIK
ncbi:MAG: T9SS type A sorting domain-containing protein [Balneola sp.]